MYVYRRMYFLPYLLENNYYHVRNEISFLTENALKRQKAMQQMCFTKELRL